MSFNIPIKRLLVASLVLVIGLAWLAWQQIPFLSYQIAASKADFPTVLPVSPPGFEIQTPIKYDGTRLLIELKDQAGNQLDLYQQASAADPESLAYRLGQEGIDYETHSLWGRKIFLYWENKAVWVSRGVQYTIIGDQVSGALVLDFAAKI